MLLDMKDTSLEGVIKNALEEDIGSLGDVTSECLIDSECESEFSLVVNEDAVLAGLEVFKNVFLLLDKNMVICSSSKDGDKIKSNTIVASVSGKTLSILKAERTALNFICHLSGIASMTNRLVNLIKDTAVILLDTRKTTPNMRLFEKQAILSGGAKNHRFNLSEMVLIKDNHISSLGSVKSAILKVRDCYGKKYKIEVEVKDFQELNEALLLKPDVIMFDNWKINDLKRALKLVPDDIDTEASGQINIENIADYAKTGVKYISTSYMVKHASWIDFSLNAVEVKHEIKV
ncbi:MAG: carboxylating nicotinate-nucleotide diphosphorylase [Candidatus Melainabacteria bacterium]|nr:carboxylating nicotinate-nucleotide diphosphorylase [Candidatus Melainabacteria bacterium]